MADWYDIEDPEDRHVETVDITGNDDPLGPAFDPGDTGDTGGTGSTPPDFDADTFWKDLYGDLGGTSGFGEGPVKFGNFFDPYGIGYGFDPNTAGSSYDAWMGNPDVLKYAKDTLNKPEFSGKSLLDVVTGLYDKFKEFAKSPLGKGVLGTLGGLAAVKFDKKPPSGGGYTEQYVGYTPTLSRKTVNTPFGPLVQYTRTPGGIGNLPPGGGGGGGGGGGRPPEANTPVNNPNTDQEDKTNRFAQGGPLRLEDGGFIMTGDAVRGAGGPQGIQSLIPGTQMIRGPGTDKSDSIKAVIHGENGEMTPAAVSNGEAYIPKAAVEDHGGAERLYNLMNNLQRRG